MSRHAALHLINTLLGGVKKHADDYRRATRVLRPVVRVVSSVSFIINLICSIMTAAARRSHLSYPNVTPLCVASPSENPLPATSASAMLSPVASVCRDIILFLSASAGHIFTWKDGACAYAVADRSKTSLLSVAKNLSLPSCPRVAISNFETNKLTNNLNKMKRNLLKTVLVAVGLVAGMSSAWGQGVWSTIFAEDYNDAATFNKFWSSAITGRYTINQTLKSGTDYVMEVVPVSNGDNGTFATYTGLTTTNSAVDAYQTAEQFRITFEFNFSYNKGNRNQTPYFQIMNSAGTEVIGFYSTSITENTGSLRLNSSGSATGGTELATFTFECAGKTPTTYNTVVLYTNGVGTYMDVTWAGQTEAQTYTIAENEIIHFGKMVHNTKRYSNHFVFDNLKVELYSEQEIVGAPQAAITAINGTKRTIAITAQDSSHEIYYYLGDDDSNPTKYESAFEVSESTTLHYYAQSASGAKSEVMEMIIECKNIVLAQPTVIRTGANSYKISAPQPEVSGLTPVATIHYSMNGIEGTLSDGEVLTGVNSDFDVWATATGYTDSEKATITYVAPFNMAEVWSYDINSFPSAYSITSIADAIDTGTETTLNGLTVYNFKNINQPDLYVENSNNWLLRNQSANAFKAYGGETTVTFNSVTPKNVIYINSRKDDGGNIISGVTNGKVAYSYNNGEYFIVPETDGAVTVTFARSTNMGVVAVQTTVQIVSIPGNAFATYCPAYPVEFAADGAIEAYKASVDEAKQVVNLTRTYQVAAGEGVLVHAKEGETATEEVNIIAPIEKDASNAFVGTLEGLTVDDSNYGTVYFLGNGSKGLGFYKAANNVTLDAGKAYLLLPATSEAKSYSIAFGGDTTGINEVVAAAKADGAYYTLSGVRVENPTKGLYIQNGKKVIIK